MKNNLILEREIADTHESAEAIWAKVIRLTKRGEALREACAEARYELTVAAMRALGKTNLSRLQRDLNTLITSLTASSK